MVRGSFHWDDPLLLDEQLTEVEKMVRDAARDYAQGSLAPRVTEAFRREYTDPAIFKEMGQLGLLGATIPPEYGGGGLNYVSYGVIAREVARGESIGCFGLTEPNHGSDPGSMITRARGAAGGYSLSGAKTWISNSPIAD